MVTSSAGSDVGLVLNSDVTFSTAIRMFRQSANNSKFAYRGSLTTTIDANANLSSPLDGNIRVATHQRRVTMCFHTGTSTKDAARDGRRSTSCCIFLTYHHLCIVFHATYLTAAIDITIHRTGTDSDICGKHYGFLTPPCGIRTSARSKHIAMVG